MSDELLRQIIERLDTLIELQRKPPSMSYHEYSLPWPFRLCTESTSGEDMDGNNLRYGIDFIFNQSLASHPPILHSIHQELSIGWGNKPKMTFIEYVKTLPDDAPFRQHVIDHIRGLRDGSR